MVEKKKTERWFKIFHAVIHQIKSVHEWIIIDQEKQRHIALKKQISKNNNYFSSPSWGSFYALTSLFSYVSTHTFPKYLQSKDEYTYRNQGCYNMRVYNMVMKSGGSNVK